jgi:hypothetical protein
MESLAWWLGNLRGTDTSVFLSRLGGTSLRQRSLEHGRSGFNV